MERIKRWMRCSERVLVLQQSRRAELEGTVWDGATGFGCLKWTEMVPKSWASSQEPRKAGSEMQGGRKLLEQYGKPRESWLPLRWEEARSHNNNPWSEGADGWIGGIPPTAEMKGRREKGIHWEWKSLWQPRQFCLLNGNKLTH